MPNVNLPVTPSGIIKGVKAFDDLASNIANPPPDRAIEGAIGRGGQKLCDAYGSLPGPATIALGPFRPIVGLLCQPYFDGAGFDPPVPTEPPFLGGQCEGSYFIEIQTKGPDTGFVFQTSFNLDGPIQSITRAQTGPFSFRFTGVGANGIPVVVNVGILSGGDARFLNPVALFDEGPGCGNLPTDGELEPGANPPPVPPDYTPGIDFGIDPDGQPFFFVPPINDPSDPTGPGIDFDPTEPAGGPSALPESNPAGGPDAVGDGEDIGTPEAGAGEDADFGEPPEGRVWVGAIAQFNAPSSIGNIPGTGPENTVYPRVVGNISLIYGDVRGEALQVRSQWIDVMRPTEALEVTGCRVNSLPGVGVTLYPISAQLCPEGAPCPVE